MPKYELESPPENRQTDTGLITQNRAQLDQFYAEMREFDDMNLSGAMASLAGMSAWASELRGKIQRTDLRRLQSFRTKELDPFLDEVDRQFKIWSRMQSVKSMEWDISRGGV